MIYFHPAARRDFEEAQDYYWDIDPDLGERFEEEVAGLLDEILVNPRVFARGFEGFRRAVIRGFPYVVYFDVVARGIAIAAVFHGRRDPSHLGGRR